MSRLGNYVNSVIDNRGKNPEYYSEGKEHPVLDNFLISGNKYPSLNSVKRFIDENIYNSFIRNYAKKDDVAITLVGNGCGNCCLVPSDDWVIIQNTIGLQLNDSLNSHFLYYYLKLHKTRVVQLDGGSSQPNIRMDNFLNLEVDFPKIKTQVNTAKVLSDLDAKIELNNKVNAELESMAKLIYDYWFVQYDFPDENGKPYKSSGGKMVYNEELKREIPDGWEEKKLSDFADTGSGGTPLKSKKEFYERGDIPWITSGEVNKPFIIKADKLITEEGLNNSSAKMFKRGTILMAMYGATAGKVSFMDMEACTNQAICAINPFKEYYSIFTKYALEDLYYYLVNLSSGSARDNLSQDKIKNLKFPFPQDDLLKSYDKMIRSSFELILKNLKENNKLVELRDWLLPMLMNGQVTVN